MQRIIVKIIFGNALTRPPPHPRDVRAGGHDVNLRLAAGGGNPVGHGISNFLVEAVQFQGGNEVAHQHWILSRAGQHHVADHAALPDLFGMTGGAAVGAINLQTHIRFTGPADRIKVGCIQNGGLFRAAQLPRRR